MFTTFTTALKISFFLATSSVVFANNEVSAVIQNFANWRVTQKGFPLELPPQYARELEQFSDQEILQGFVEKMESFDTASNTSASNGAQIATILKFNHDLVNDVSSLRIELSKEKMPRRFYHLARLGYAFTEARKDDFIPEYFNFLFRDGRVSMMEGEYTAAYADDVSKFAYLMIVESLKQFASEYSPLTSNSSATSTHEMEVDHLAEWLIANWPGCENFTLSDQNVPAILAANPSSKRTSGQSRPPNQENTNPTEETSKPSWPLLTAILLLLGSVAYWGKKRFAS